MATVTLQTTYQNEVDGTSFTTGSFTPNTNDLIVVSVCARGTILTTPTMTSSVGGKTFTRAYSVYPGSIGTTSLFIADQLASNASQTVTFDCTSDDATSVVITVYTISGMTKLGSAALLQTAVDGTGTVDPTFSSSPLTTNPIVCTVFTLDNSPGLTAPTGFATAVETIGSSPTGSVTTTYASSGITSATNTWGGSLGSGFRATHWELDASASAALARSFGIICG